MPNRDEKLANGALRAGLCEMGVSLLIGLANRLCVCSKGITFLAKLAHS